MKKNVILFCFAGRRPNLELQLPLVRRILADNPNVEAHYWNFARNDADREYVKTISGPQITVFNGTDGDFASPTPTGDEGAKQFGANEHNAAYRHYSQPEFSEHLFVKVDDDIVFLETGRFGKFIEAIDTHRGKVIAANIINNGASTPIEPGIWEGFQRLKMPLLDIHIGREYPEMAHGYFFEHHDKVLNQPIKLIPTEDWLSINAIGYDWNTLVHVIKTIGTPQPAHLSGRPMHGWGRVFGDEGVFQTLDRIIMKGFTAAHLTFGPQRPTEEQLDRWRENYRRIGQEYMDSEASRTFPRAKLPKLSPVSCGFVGVRLKPLPEGLAGELMQKFGPNNWRVRAALGENDPCVGRYSP